MPRLLLPRNRKRLNMLRLDRNSLACLLIILSALFSAAAASVTTLDLGVSISTSAQREAYYSLVQQFEDLNPDIKVKIKAYTSEDYKQEFPALLNGEQHYDILYWHAGERLQEFVKPNQVAQLDSLWSEQGWNQSFDKSVISSLSHSGHKYGLPVSYYQIGFYYRKSLFQRLGLEPPKTWQALLQVCHQLKSKGIAPIFIGSDSNWPATAWFDYLNLRINGLGFHQKLLTGEASFLSPEVSKVFETWLDLIEPGYFIDGHENFHWKEGLPSIYRELSGMSMIGNYVIQDIPDNVIDDIGYFPFPQIDERVPNFEEAPLDILIIPQKSIHKAAAMRFLAFAGSHQVQSRFNKTLGVISPHRKAQIGTSRLVKEAYDVLQKASGISQFFDRDASKSFADQAMPIIDEFMLNRNIAYTVNALEQVRARHLGLQISAESPLEPQSAN